MATKLLHWDKCGALTRLSVIGKLPAEPVKMLEDVTLYGAV